MANYETTFDRLREEGVIITPLTDEQLGLLTVALSNDLHINPDNYEEQQKIRQKAAQSERDIKNIPLI